MKKEEIKIESNKTKNIFFDIIVALCVALFAIAIAPKTLQNDTFYTIKIGEYIMQNGISDLTHDEFSCHDLPYTYPHWLYDIGIYLVYNFFGQKRYIYFNNNIYSIVGSKHIFIKQ